MANRSRGLTVGLVVAAVAVWGLAGARVVSRTHDTIAPPRHLAFVKPDGAAHPLRGFMHCHGPAVVAIDRVWRTCSTASTTRRWDDAFLVRFELDRGRAVMIPLPPHVDGGVISGFAVGPDQQLALLAGASVVRIRDDVAEVVGRAPDPALGIAWVNGAIEVVTGWSEPVVHRFDAEPTTTALPVPPREPGTPVFPWLVLAWHEPSGWRLLYDSRGGRELPGDTLLEGDARGGPWTPIPVIHPVVAREIQFEGARGGMLRWSTAPWRATLVADQAGWRPFAPPTPVADDIALSADFLLRDGALTMLPRLESGLHELGRAQVATPEGWLAIGLDHDDLYLRELDGRRGPRLVGYRWIDDRANLAPASAGGLWLLGTFGAHIRVDGLRRVDEMSTLDRVRAFDASFDHPATRSDWHQEDRWRKRAAIPVLLLGLPVAAMAALISGRLLRRRRATAVQLTMAIYLLAAATLARVFWEVTAQL